jgi:dTDP-4-dehydrorhamnose 3,5-epimerase-like enzyme
MPKRGSTSKCKLINITTLTDSRGNLGVIESDIDIPFAIQRAYFLYGVPAGERRGAHGHHSLEQVMLALTGQFDVMLDDGSQTAHYQLSDPSTALYISPMIWRELHSFSDNAVCLVLASQKYDESDYYRNYSDFIKAVKVTW